MKHLFAQHLAFVIGCALGDGNLSRPNGRATRLRITCDAQYPKFAQEIITSLEHILPTNKVSVVPRTQTYFDISVYSNKLDDWMPWRVGLGSKIIQQVHVPEWVKEDVRFIRPCVRGLILTDGCIYTDRGYQMVNFVNNARSLAEDVRDLIQSLGYNPRFTTQYLGEGRNKHTVKLARQNEVTRICKELRLTKR